MGGIILDGYNKQIIINDDVVLVRSDVNELSIGEGDHWKDNSIGWSAVDKTGSNLSDLGTVNYSDLSGRPEDDDFHTLSSTSSYSDAYEVAIWDNVLLAYKKTTRATFLTGVEPTVSKGDLTSNTTSAISVFGGTGAVIGSGASITINKASAFVDGYLGKDDWSTFNNKQDTITKYDLSETSSGILTITGGTDSVLTNDVTIQVKKASALQDGYLGKDDWSKFNNQGALIEDITYYVDGDSGNDSNDGLSWGTAKKTFAFLYSEDSDAIPREIKADLTIRCRGTILSKTDQRHTYIDNFYGSGSLTIIGEVSNKVTGLTPTGWENTYSSVNYHSYITVAGVTWTSGEHEGDFIQFTSPASDEMYPILKNTATQLETVGLPDLAGTETFKIVKLDAIFKGATVAVPGTIVDYPVGVMIKTKNCAIELNLHRINVAKDLYTSSYSRGVVWGNCLATNFKDTTTQPDFLRNSLVKECTIRWMLSVGTSPALLSCYFGAVSVDNDIQVSVFSGVSRLFLYRCVLGSDKSTVANGIESYWDEVSISCEDVRIDKCDAGIKLRGGRASEFINVLIENCNIGISASNSFIDFYFGNIRFKNNTKAISITSGGYLRHCPEYQEIFYSGNTNDVVLWELPTPGGLMFAELALRTPMANAISGAFVSYYDPVVGEYSESRSEYDNISSGLTATRYQTAIDELADYYHNPVTLNSSAITGGLSLNNQEISFRAADTNYDGYLKSSDWDIFNGKQDVITKYDLSETTSGVLTIIGGTDSVLTNDVTIQVKKASASQDGYLGKDDWSTFNSKEPAQTKGTISSGTSSVISITNGSSSTVGPNVSVSINKASASQDGYLGKDNWATFNSKEPAQTKGSISETVSSIFTITNGSNSTVGPNVTIQAKKASSSQDGYLAKGDWTTFNTASNKFYDLGVYGFTNDTSTSISFNDSNYTFTLTDTGSGWSYYRNGTKNTISGNKTTTFSGAPPASGIYFIYIDDDIGTLSHSNSPWTLFDNKVLVALVIWNNSNSPKYWIADERHKSVFPRYVHSYLHYTRGTALKSGGIPGGYVVSPVSPIDTDNTFSITETEINDEDIKLVLSSLSDGTGSSNNYTVFYRTASSTWAWKRSFVPFSYTGTGYIEYDNSGTLTPAINSNFVNYYLLYTNLSGDGRYIVVPGRSSFNSATEAYSESWQSFDWSGFPISECILAYQVTFQTSSSYSTLGKVRIQRIPQKIISSFASVSVSATSVDHNSLSGLSGGSPYNHLSDLFYGYATQSSSSVKDGYLTSVDWNTFNSKEPAQIKGSISETASSVLTVTNGSSSTVGPNVTIQVKKASALQDGYLGKDDWATFNSKEPAQTKGSISETASSVLTITNGSNSTVGPNVTVQVKKASAAQDGYLSKGDWTTFNNKASGIPTSITVANEATDTTCFPLFVTSATGDLGPKTNTNLTYNSSTSSLSLIGHIGIGSASNTYSIANIQETGSGDANAFYGAQIFPTLNGNVSSTYQGLRILTYASGSPTIPSYYGIYNVASMASCVPINTYGLYISGYTSGTTKWDLYANDSTAYNYFAGKVGVGVAEPQATLDVQSASAWIRAYGSTNPYISAQDSTNDCVVKMQALDTFAYVGTQSDHQVRFIVNNSSKAYLTSTGRFGIGSDAPASVIHTVYEGAEACPIFIGHSSSDTDFAVKFVRSSGTTSSPVAVANDMRLGGIYIYGYYNSSSTALGAAIQARSAGLWSASNLGTFLNFFTTAQNTTSVLERMRITDSGNVGIGASAPTSLFQVGSKATNEVNNIVSRSKIYGSVTQSQTEEVMLRFIRNENSSQYYPGSVDFKLSAYQAGGSPFSPASKLVMALKAAENFNEGADVDVMTLFSSGKVGIMNTSPSALLTLGTAGTTAGSLSLAGAISGTCTVQVAAAAGTTTFQLPSSNGTSGQFLKTDGSGVTSWSAVPNDSLDTGVADHSYSGTTITMTAGETVAIGDLCYLKSDGKLWKADADAVTTSDGMLAIATSAISADASGVFLLRGLYRDDTWNWTIGSKLYIDTTPGNPTATAPSATGDIVRIVGHALSADIIYFNPDNTYVELT